MSIEYYKKDPKLKTDDGYYHLRIRGDGWQLWLRSEDPGYPQKAIVEVSCPDVALDAPLSHDEAVHLASALVETSLLRCSPELREKFNNLVRDMQK